jgi:hypothetical protein
MDLIEWITQSQVLTATASVLGILSALWFFGGKLLQPLRSVTQKPARQIYHPSPELLYRSNFADSRDELDIVLRIRSSFFGTDVITSDDTYVRCWNKNSDCFKIVYNPKGKPIGYWGIAPTSQFVYDRFLEGVMTHSTILTSQVKSWQDVRGEPCYLYIIGAVVPHTMQWMPGASRNNKIRSCYVIMDMINFMIDVEPHLSIHGVFGYPSEKGGHDILNKFGFRKNGKYIDGNANQPACFVPHDDLPHLMQNLRAYLRGMANFSPVWDRPDRDRLLNIMTTYHGDNAP